ncbi:MAG TPA: hypothetical protein VL475_16115, partial [Planctomycetaceae bacterium]|nr:hypothetical protein [Planctomycetaceae bacterium]
MRLFRSRWILGPLVAVVLATPAVRAQPDDTEPAKKSSVAYEGRPDVPPPVDAGDAGKPAEDQSDADKPADEPAAAGKGVPVPAMVPMFQRFGGRLRMIMRRNVAIPVQADEILQEESDAPRSVVLPDNGDIRRRLEKIRGEIADEHLADAARHLGQLLQNSEIRDFFLSRDEDRRDGRSFQAEVRRLIETLPPEGRAAYRAQFEAVARQQLNAAILNGGESALREVTRRFPSTAAGSEALYRLGQFLWDHGRPEAAAACLERLRGAPDAAAIEPAVSILLAACRQRAGQGAQFRAAVEELRTREIPVKTQIAGRPLVELLHGERVAEVLGEMLGLMVTAPPADEVDWSVFRGDPARNRKVAAGAPLLAARWTHEIAG